MVYKFLKEKRFSTDIYPYEFFVLSLQKPHIPEQESIKKIMSNLTNDEYEEIDWINDKGNVYEIDDNTSLILILEYNHLDNIDLITTIRHETCHASANLYRSIGAEPDYLDSEPYLYLTDYLFKECLELFENITL